MTHIMIFVEVLNCVLLVFNKDRCIHGFYFYMILVLIINLMSAFSFCVKLLTLIIYFRDFDSWLWEVH